jgi:SAM-dependent methyltransferase
VDYVRATRRRWITKPPAKSASTASGSSRSRADGGEPEGPALKWRCQCSGVPDRRDGVLSESENDIRLTPQTSSGFPVSMGTAEDDVLSAQLAYYNSRAGEYDSDLYQDPASTDRIELLLTRLTPSGRTVELACGTGIWTKLLAPRVQSLTAIDGSPEMLAVTRQRLGDTPVNLVETDIFDWQPDERFDTVFFAFWLSHVPPSRFESFWGTLRDALAAKGRVLFVDTGREEARFEQFVPGAGIPMVERQLRDGTTYSVVKMLYDPTDLADRLAAIGWTADIRAAGGTFFAGTAVPS